MTVSLVVGVSEGTMAHGGALEGASPGSHPVW